MITKNQIAKIFEDFANGHIKVNYFGYTVNSLFDVDKKDADGVVIWVTSKAHPVSNVVKYGYDVFIMDVVNKQEDDSAEVESDTATIGLELIKHINETEFDEEIDVEFGGSMEPFVLKFDSLYAGNVLSFNVTIPFALACP